ncbi:peptidoglycan-binding domain-containing protein [Actinomyces ruminicola]|uniref:peptidoglycan-binding domain-containing protein n=1 Tax=Actinomyces ruminicola TaxID=332524 RepID=UPI00115FC4D9|nr:hypothetical protein [Actinomyces ruminicola]
MAGAITISFTDVVRPEVLEDASSSTVFKPTTTEFDDARDINISVSFNETQTIYSPTSGLVTSTECSPGQQIKSGTAAMSVDANTIIALATASPLYRDLSIDDEGEDVSALQKALVDLGYMVAVDGKVGRYTLGAVSDLLGEKSTLTTIPISRIMWIPSASANVSSCTHKLGARVEVGEALMEVPGDISGASFAIPTGAVPGERTISIEGDDRSFPVNADGTITDADALQVLQSAPSSPQPRSDGTSSGDATDASTQSRTVEASWVLADPLALATIVPSALYDIDGVKACVQDAAGAAYQVEIITSRLGKTLVNVTTIDGVAAEPREVVLNPVTGVPCR